MCEFADALMFIYIPEQQNREEVMQNEKKMNLHKGTK